jgi:tripartite-type tricarboxylate transporter receptor subunit TctC
MPSVSRLVICLRLLACMLSAVPFASQAAERLVHVIVPFGTGGDLDTLARLFSQKMGTVLNETWIVENYLGGSGRVGTGRVLQAKPDGTTLLFNSSIHYVAPLVIRDLPYDPIADFVPIGPVVRTPLVLMASPSQVKANRISDLIADMKASPGRYTFGYPGLGASGHVAAEAFMEQAGVQGMLVPYTGTGQAVTDVMGGSISMVFVTPLLAAQFVQSPRIKALASTSRARLEGIKDLPTMSESGLPGFEMSNTYGYWGPKGMPEAEAARLNAALHKVAEMPEVKARLAQLGMNASWETPQVFAQRIGSDFENIKEILVKAGVQPE